MKSKPEPILFLDDHRGIYIPRDFATDVKRECVSGVSDEDWKILEAGPEHEAYWDVWSDVTDNAKVTEAHDSLSKDNPAHRETVYSLYQDGALWLIPEGMEWSDDADWFEWPSETIAVKLSQSDDDNGMVTLYCNNVEQAKHDQSVCLDGQSSRWEIVDGTLAICSLGNFYDLSKALTEAGYDVDDSEYSAPDDEDLAYWAYRADEENNGCNPLDRDAWLASRECKHEQKTATIWPVCCACGLTFRE